MSATPSAEAGRGAEGSQEAATTAPPQIMPFHMAAIAMQRARQLQMGARPRIADAVGHKPTRIALQEVLANAVSWEIV